MTCPVPPSSRATAIVSPAARGALKQALVTIGWPVRDDAPYVDGRPRSPARELAAATGETITGAVATAVQERLQRVRGVARAPVLADFCTEPVWSSTAVDAHQAELAREAWRRFGKGRHPAALDYGDCFSYALAVDSREPLLCVGDDFRRTDVPLALTAI